MGFRVRKSLRIGGLRLNLGKRGITSVSAGLPGFRVSVGRRGVSRTIGIPGSGLSHTRLVSAGAKAGSSADAPPSGSPLWRLVGIAALLVAVWGMWTDPLVPRYAVLVPAAPLLYLLWRHFLRQNPDVGVPSGKEAGPVSLSPEVPDDDEVWLRSLVEALLEELQMASWFHVINMMGSPSGWASIDYLDQRSGGKRRTITVSQISEASLRSDLRRRLKKVRDERPAR